MPNNILLNYQLKDSDYIEAEQLKLIKSTTAWLNLLFSVVFVINGVTNLNQVSDRNLLVFEYLKELWISEEIKTNYLLSAIFYFGLALLISFETFPKYNPLYR